MFSSECYCGFKNEIINKYTYLIICYLIDMKNKILFEVRIEGDLLLPQQNIPPFHVATHCQRVSRYLK